MIRCEKCHSEVRSERMDSHLRERCPARNSTLARQKTSPPPTRKAVLRVGSDSPRRLTGNVISGGSTKPVYLGKHGSKRLHSTDDAESSSDPSEEYWEGRRRDGSRDYWATGRKAGSARTHRLMPAMTSRHPDARFAGDRKR